MAESRFAALLSNYDLPPSFIYLAPVMPLVAAMWADDSNQLKEQQIVRSHLLQHREALSEQVGGLEVVSDRELDAFFADFVEKKPDDRLLKELASLSLDLIAGRREGLEAPAPELYSRDALMHACLEVVAACIVDYESSNNVETAQRIAEQEKAFIRGLFMALEQQSGV